MRRSWTGAARGWRAKLSLPWLLSLVMSINVALWGQASADEVEFTPRRDAVSALKRTPRPGTEQPKRLISYTRYLGTVRILCQKMEADGRTERLVSVAEAASKEVVKGCPACRSVWRVVLTACRKPKPLRAKKRPKARQPEHNASEDNSEENGEPLAATDGDLAEQSQSPANVSKPRERLPSLEVIEVASVLSSRMHADEPGSEPTLQALDGVASRLLGQADLTVGERDYFSTLFEYLRAAWRGQPASPSEASGGSIRRSGT